MAASSRVAPITVETSSDIQWSCVIAGAICASALALVLHAFAGAVGISLSSTAPPYLARFVGSLSAYIRALSCFGGLGLVRVWCVHHSTPSRAVGRHV